MDAGHINSSAGSGNFSDAVSRPDQWARRPIRWLRRHVLSVGDVAVEGWRLAQAFSPEVPLGARGGCFLYRSGAQADCDVRRARGCESRKYLDLRRPHLDPAVSEHAAERAAFYRDG